MTEALPTSLSVVLGGRPQLRRLVDEPRSRGDLVSACAVSGSTVDRALDDLESAGCVESCEAGYRATRAGRLLHERFQAVLGAGFDEDEFELVVRRQELLETIGDRPLHKAALTDALPVSRATVNRAVADLEAASLVERATEGYVPTDRGRRALVAVRSCLGDARQIEAGREILAALPDDDRIPDEVLLGGEYVPLDDRDALVDRLAETLRVADRYRLSVPEPPGEGLLDLWRSLSIERSVVGEVLLPASAVEKLRRGFPGHAADLAAAAEFSAQAGEPPAFGLLVARSTSESSPGDAETPTDDAAVASALIVAYEDGAPVGVVEYGGGDAVAWAAEALDDLRSTADPVPAPELAPPEGAHSGGDGLPRTLRTQGFVAVDDEYFERREPLAPATAWRSGIGLPEVEAGYTAERRRDDGTSVAEELIADLADGVDTAVLGPAASGKSTVCKRVAVAWHRAERGPVFYRTSSAGSAFDDVGALEAALRGARRRVAGRRGGRRGRQTQRRRAGRAHVGWPPPHGVRRPRAPRGGCPPARARRPGEKARRGVSNQDGRERPRLCRRAPLAPGDRGAVRPRGGETPPGLNGQNIRILVSLCTG
jgi:Mn-dependent DtxR family transcriptional regulator